MNQFRSLRALLVLNTLLAGGLLWTLGFGDRSLLPTAEAAPQYRSTRTAQPPETAVTGVGNAAARQRTQIIKGLASLEGRLERLEARLKSGDYAIRIQNVEELAIDYDLLARAVRADSVD